VFVAAVAAVAATTTGTAKADLLPGLLGGNCGSTSKVFAPWGDYGSYYFATNGGLESGSTGWSLSGGAKVVSGNEPFYVHAAGDKSSLAIPAGATVTSPALCYGATYPRVRFFATSSGPVTIRVRVVTRSVLGLLRILDAGSVTFGGGWAPAPSYVYLGSALASLVGVKSMQIQLVPSGAVQIDDLYVDPLLQDG
jgi:hypothetical protein